MSVHAFDCEYAWFLLQSLLTMRSQVFSGCPQRSVDTGEMAGIILKLLYDNKEQSLSRIACPISTDNLALSVLRTTDMLMSSKITLRSRIISLYANRTQPEEINSVRISNLALYDIE